MSITVCGCSPSRPCTTEALSKWRSTVSAAFGLRPSPSHRMLEGGAAGQRLLERGALRLEVGRLERGVAAPFQQGAAVFLLGGQAQVGELAREERRAQQRFSRVGPLEHHPEVVVDDVDRHLAAAHRALDEAHQRELRLLEHQPVARLDRKLAERGERIGGHRRLVRGQGADFIGCVDEPGLETREACIVQRIRHVCLGEQRLGHAPQPVVRARHARIVIWPARGDDLDRLPGRRPGAHQLEIFVCRAGRRNRGAR